MFCWERSHPYGILTWARAAAGLTYVTGHTVQADGELEDVRHFSAANRAAARRANGR
jgi:hypothetical protein